MLLYESNPYHSGKMDGRVCSKVFLTTVIMNLQYWAGIRQSLDHDSSHINTIQDFIRTFIAQNNLMGRCWNRTVHNPNRGPVVIELYLELDNNMVNKLKIKDYEMYNKVLLSTIESPYRVGRVSSSGIVEVY